MSVKSKIRLKDWSTAKGVRKQPAASNGAIAEVRKA